MSVVSLKAGTLYAVLFYRQDSTSWHWAFFLPSLSSPTGSIDVEGTLYHCKNDPSSLLWTYEVKSRYNPIRSREGVVLIARLDDLASFGSPQVIHQSLLSPQFGSVKVKQGLPHREFDCRTWWKNAMHLLHEYGVVHCTSLDRLDKELQLKALQATPAFERNSSFAFYSKLDNV